VLRSLLVEPRQPADTPPAGDMRPTFQLGNPFSVSANTHVLVIGRHGLPAIGINTLAILFELFRIIYLVLVLSSSPISFLAIVHTIASHHNTFVVVFNPTCL